LESRLACSRRITLRRAYSHAQAHWTNVVRADDLADSGGSSNSGHACEGYRTWCAQRRSGCRVGHRHTRSERSCHRCLRRRNEGCWPGSGFDPESGFKPASGSVHAIRATRRCFRAIMCPRLASHVARWLRYVDTSHRQPWIGAAILVGVVYLLIGRLFPAPADHVRAWRLAAWAVSGVAFAAHIAYELFRLRQSPRSMALHVALAVAFGALALAVAAALHSLSSASLNGIRQIRPVWLLALIAWPLLTAVPAFVVALVAGTVLTRLRPRAAPP
jgi:hypothetical protein